MLICLLFEFQVLTVAQLIKEQSTVQVTGLVNARTHTLHASFEASVGFFLGIISALIFSNIYKAFLNDRLPHFPDSMPCSAIRMLDENGRTLLLHSCPSFLSPAQQGT